MHELSMALSLNNAIEELCARSGWTRVNRLILKFGGLRQVNPELLAFAFEVVSKGTVTEGARLSVIEIPIIFHCRSCGRDTPTENTVFVCPSCGSLDVELLSGLELAIDTMEVEQGARPLDP